MNRLLCLILFLSGSIFASENSFNKRRNIGRLSIFPNAIIGHIVKSLSISDLRSFSQTSLYARELCKTAYAQDAKTSVIIDGEWHRYFSTLFYHINDVLFPFVIIPAGTFMFGEGNNQRQVEIPAPFMMMTHEVTQKQWEAIMGNNPSHFKGEDLPVETVRYDDVQEFITKLNELLAERGLSGVRLPTEEEWEYAARAGTTTKYFWGDDKGQADKYAWYDGNSEEKTHPVMELGKNAWGLHDMIGNVWEWTYSFWSNNSQSRVIRGGGYKIGPRGLYSSVRYRGNPKVGLFDTGLRLLRTFTL